MNDTCQKIADEMRTRYGACPATIAAHAVDVANMLPRWAERLTALSAGASGGGEPDLRKYRGVAQMAIDYASLVATPVDEDLARELLAVIDHKHDLTHNPDTGVVKCYGCNYESRETTTPASPATGDWFADALTATGEAVLLDAELPGMWERADLIGGATDVAPQPQECPACKLGQATCGYHTRNPTTPPAHGDGEVIERAARWMRLLRDATNQEHEIAMLDAILAALTTRPTPEAQEARDAWIPVSERLPDDGTECLVLVQYGTDPKVYVAIDTWRMQREAPVSFSSATIETGLMWDDHDFFDVLMWQPVNRPSQPTIDNAIAALALPAQGEE